MNKFISVILFVAASLAVFAQGVNIKKSVYIDHDGTSNTRIFQYDSLDRLVRMEEYDSQETLIRNDVHVIHGQTDSVFCYIADTLAYIYAYTYTDETFKQQRRWEMVEKDGSLIDSACYEYDSIGRMVCARWGNSDGMYLMYEYSYKPFRSTSIETQPKSGRESVIYCAYWDRNCSREKRTKKVVDGVSYTSRTTYYKDGRRKLWRRYENRMLVEKISSKYHGNVETTTNMVGTVITSYY